MDRNAQARQLDALAGEAATLAEAQALHARADRLRGQRGSASGWRLPLIRN